MDTWYDLAVAWFAVSLVGGGIVGSAGTTLGGPPAGAALAAVTAGLALVYACDSVLVARRADPDPGTAGEVAEHSGSD